MSIYEPDGYAAPLRVMQSFGAPRPTTNPYIVQLAEALTATPGIEHLPFSWRLALWGHFDVIHFHWPEALLDGTTPLKRAGKALALAALVARLQLERKPVVRTVHNVGLPSGVSPFVRWLLGRIEKLAAVCIVLNSHTPTPSSAKVILIPHGDYRRWFARYPKTDSVQGRLAFAGLVRRYKGVENLVDLIVAMEDPTISLDVSGRPTSAELEADLLSRAGHDPRIKLDLRFLDDAELVTALTSAELVVLPYRFMHNSGTVLAALSVDRPVLVPSNEVNADLAEEVGEGWVRQYHGELGADDLRDALAESPSSLRPDLTNRDWADTGAHHREAYRAALDARRRV